MMKEATPPKRQPTPQQPRESQRGLLVKDVAAMEVTENVEGERELAIYIGNCLLCTIVRVSS